MYNLLGGKWLKPTECQSHKKYGQKNLFWWKNVGFFYWLPPSNFDVKTLEFSTDFMWLPPYHIIQIREVRLLLEQDFDQRLYIIT